jgi:hypothetical protein
VLEAVLNAPSAKEIFDILYKSVGATMSEG